MLAIVLTLGVIGVGGAFTYDFLTNSSTATTQQIPNIVGLPENEAVLELEQLGFTVVLTTEPSPDVAEGLVIRTSPNVGSEIREGATVTLTISSGREVVTIPDVTGLTLAEATQEIEGAGLVLDQSIREENSDDYPAGTVIQQNPQPGGETSVGASITLTVSTGPSLVRVPVITGMQWSQAESNITSLGLVPDISYVDSLLPEGQVISASGQGTELPRGSTVSVEVSNGMLIEAPDLARLDVEDAREALRDAGWTAPDTSLVEGAPIPTGALVDQGRIAFQEPAPGETLRKDAVVSIRLYRFDLTALVPEP